MWFWKTSIAAEEFGSDMVAELIDVEACREDVRVLRDHEVPENIALSEMAFARAGLMQAIFEDELRQPVADRAIQASNRFLFDAFKDQNLHDALGFYQQSLVSALPDRVRFYRGKAFPLSQLAASLGAVLKVRGHPASEALFMFEAIDAKIVSK